MFWYQSVNTQHVMTAETRSPDAPRVSQCKYTNSFPFLPHLVRCIFPFSPATPLFFSIDRLGNDLRPLRPVALHSLMELTDLATAGRGRGPGRRPADVVNTLCGECRRYAPHCVTAGTPYISWRATAITYRHIFDVPPTLYTLPTQCEAHLRRVSHNVLTTSAGLRPDTSPIDVGSGRHFRLYLHLDPPISKTRRR